MYTGTELLELSLSEVDMNAARLFPHDPKKREQLKSLIRLYLSYKSLLMSTMAEKYAQLCGLIAREESVTMVPVQVPDEERVMRETKRKLQWLQLEALYLLRNILTGTLDSQG